MELLYLWVGNYKDIFVEQGFNFNPRHRFAFEPEKNAEGEITGGTLTHEARNFPEDFFPKGVSNVTAIVGKNGSGKSNLLEFILNSDVFFENVNHSRIYCLVALKNSNDEIEVHSEMPSATSVKYEGKVSQNQHIPTLEAVLYNPTAFFYLKPTDTLSVGLESALAKFSIEQEGSPTKDVFRFTRYIFPESEYLHRILDYFIKDCEKGIADIATLKENIFFLREKSSGEDFKRSINFLGFLVGSSPNQNVNSVRKELLDFFPTSVELKISVEKLSHLEPRIQGAVSIDPKDLEDTLEEYIEKLGEIQDIKDIITLNMLQDMLSKILKSANLDLTFYDNIILHLKNNKGLKELTKIFETAYDDFANALQTIEETYSSFGEDIRLSIDSENYTAVKSWKIRIGNINSNYLKVNKLIETFENIKLKHDVFDIDALPDVESDAMKFSFTWQDLSFGERKLIQLFSELYYRFEKSGYFKPKLIMLDEAELGFHPEWQRKALKYILILLELLGKEYNTNFHLILTSHSPFVLSDLPKECVIFLERNTEDDKKNGFKGIGRVVSDPTKKTQTFGANIHTLFTEGFFLDSLVGEFAKEKINGVIESINAIYARKRNLEGKELGEDDQEEIKELRKFVAFIGEPILQAKLLEMLDEIEGKDLLQAEEDRLNKRLEEIKAQRKRNKPKDND